MLSNSNVAKIAESHGFSPVETTYLTSAAARLPKRGVSSLFSSIKADRALSLAIKERNIREQETGKTGDYVEKYRSAQRWLTRGVGNVDVPLINAASKQAASASFQPEAHEGISKKLVSDALSLKFARERRGKTIVSRTIRPAVKWGATLFVAGTLLSPQIRHIERSWGRARNFYANRALDVRISSATQAYISARRSNASPADLERLRQEAMSAQSTARRDFVGDYKMTPAQSLQALKIIRPVSPKLPTKQELRRASKDMPMHLAIGGSIVAGAAGAANRKHKKGAKRVVSEHTPDLALLRKLRRKERSLNKKDRKKQRRKHK
jgi:hypothetical protein